MKLPLVILTGASGSGKTTLARHIQQRYPLKYKVFFFDSIGVPPAEQIAAEYGSGEAWQRAMALQWMKRIAPMQLAHTPVLLEGQMRIAFIQEALYINRIESARMSWSTVTMPLELQGFASNAPNPSWQIQP